MVTKLYKILNHGKYQIFRYFTKADLNKYFSIVFLVFDTLRKRKWTSKFYFTAGLIMRRHPSLITGKILGFLRVTHFFWLKVVGVGVVVSQE